MQKTPLILTALLDATNCETIVRLVEPTKMTEPGK